MNYPLYIISVWVHIIAATFWIGSMLFLTLVLIPSLRAQGNPGFTARMIATIGPRYRAIAWGAIILLIVSGLMNLTAKGIGMDMLGSSAFWAADYGNALRHKMELFVIVILLSIIHDAVIGPRLRKIPPDQTERREKLRNIASWMGRITLILSLVIILFAVMMTRGTPW